MKNGLGRAQSNEEDGVLGTAALETEEEADISRVAISSIEAKEKEIERRKTEVRERVEDRLVRAEEETRRLSLIWEELEELVDPMRKEVAAVRKKIDVVLRELKPLGQSCQKREKEYKEAMEAFNEKSKERAQLVSAQMQLLSESEQLRMKKLEELSMNI
ncbi:hypothetical protein MLD38_003758 [Melastoma candidum]|uniref:Uncharacterized protein n=1 Tax=Melastoma candidum TaxID=119954 RepID=A0ACB9S3L5_9MYRT|nr:hypothetical protein MLD38_003758 [Melastoma candidum]